MRNSSIEWIKIMAVVFVVLCHSVPETYTFPDGQTFTDGFATANPAFFAVGLISGLGLIGDVIFIVCSSYFLLDGKKVKAGKVFAIILNVLIISVIYLVIILALGYKLSPMTIVRQCFPTTFQNNWFITYYIIFYLLHPVFNTIIEVLDKKRLALAAGLLFFHCSILLFFTGNAPGINKFICFVNIYFLVAYFKYYGGALVRSKRLNVAVCVSCAALYVIMKAAVNALGLHFDHFQSRTTTYFHINNPVLILFALSLFNLVNTKIYFNRSINYLSSLSLLIYIIHRNNLFAELIQPKWYDLFVLNYGKEYFIPAILTLAAILFAASVAAATVYRFTAERGVNALGAKIQSACDRLMTRLRGRT